LSCSLSVEERDLLQKHLGDLEDTMPPRYVWHRIEEQAHAEGLFKRSIGVHVKWLAGLGTAAALFLAVINFSTVKMTVDQESQYQTKTTVLDETDGANSNQNLNSLMVQSRAIERNLRILPAQPKIVRVGTAVTITEIEDRIAEVDYYLNNSEVDLESPEAEIYWRERVRLMNSLLDVRSAQLQQVVFDQR
tara:strand:+ start:701 stop:1273 length:573 start_codon:yes stop_codon:yes gene_type:complete